jgi:hypothetical protein
VLHAPLKVANEALQYLKVDLRRAHAEFSQEFIDKCMKKKKKKKQNEFKARLSVPSCFFHALVTSKKKCDSQKQSRVPNNNEGDLLVCAYVMRELLCLSKTSAPAQHFRRYLVRWACHRRE